MRERSEHYDAAESGHAKDRELVRAVLRGDGPKTVELLERLACVPNVVRHMNRKRGHPLGEQDVEDVIQGVLTSLWAKLRRYDGRRALEAWTYGFCLVEHHRAMERRRRRERTRLGFTGDTFPDRAPGAEALDRTDAIFTALELAGPPGNEIVRLKHFEGLTFREIGISLSAQENTVKTQYYRCLERMRTLLSPFRSEASAVREGDHDR